MKKGDIYCGRVSEAIFPRKGIVELPDASVVIEGVYPEQEVCFRIAKKRSKRIEGRLLSVEKKAAYEIAPSCSFFDACGGCSFANLPYEMELEAKSDYVKGLLKQAFEDYYGDSSILDRCYKGIIPAVSTSAYRNKMEFTFGDASKGGELELGLHKRYSAYDIITVRDCDIVHEDFLKLLSATLDYAKSKGWSHYHRMQHQGLLRHLLIRRATFTGEIMVAIVTTSEQQEGFEDWCRELLKLELSGRLVSVSHIVNDGVADTVRADDIRLLHGRDFIYEELMGLSFKISIFSFFQTNSVMAEKLYGRVSDLLDNACKDVVLDLYCGTGTIAQSLAKKSRLVLGIELVEEAVEAARINAELNGLDNCIFIAGDVGEITKQINELRGSIADGGGTIGNAGALKLLPDEAVLRQLMAVDTIVVDPPREGLRSNAMEQILSFGAGSIVYVSCKPSSLARDIAGFLAAGYEARHIETVDMFPRTANVETIVLLSKLDSKKYISVELPMDDMDLTSAESKATYKQIQN